jgi:soluble lytic murein transglycosylase-like protein
MLESLQEKLVILGPSRLAGQAKNPSGRAPAFIAGGGILRPRQSRGLSMTITQTRWRAEARRYILLLLVFFLPLTPAARADYAVLRNGQRLHITGHERAGSVVRLQMAGGSVEVAADQLVAIEPEEFFPGLAAAKLDVPFAELIRAAAQKHGVDQTLIASVIAVESNFNPRAVSPKFARGLMQLLPETAARLAVADVFDPRQNIDAGTRYLKELLARYHQDLALTLAAYNAGPDRVEQFRGVPPFLETRNYVQRVTRRLNEHTRRRQKTRTVANR